MSSRICVLLALVILCGCGKSYRVASVSGKVTLDGKPLAKATVTFAPMGTKENQSPGPTSHGGTDSDGRYSLSLSLSPPSPGSVVGKNRVYISTVLSDPVTDDRDAGGPVKKVRDKIPEKYNMKTELVYEVLPDGTSEANFDLKSR